MSVAPVTDVDITGTLIIQGKQIKVDDIEYSMMHLFIIIVCVTGLVFVVDSADRERIIEAREELFSIMDFPDMTGVPVVVIANKQDLPSKLL
jgi:GTPase SAR1 family protein